MNKKKDDTRSSGNCSDVKVISPEGKISYQKATYFESIPLRSKNFRGYYEDMKTSKKESNK